MKMVRLILNKLRYETCWIDIKLVFRVIMYEMLIAAIFWIMFELGYVCVVACVIALPVSVLESRRQLFCLKQRTLNNEFSLFLRRLSATLAAGSTMTNAIREIVINGKEEYPTMYPELNRMYRKIEYNTSVTEAFEYLAQRCNTENIKLFAQCLSYAVPSGIDLVNLIRNISASFNVKNDTQRDIERILNLPRYNNRIMLIAPVFCLVLIKNIAPEYVEPLYNGGGRLVMVFVMIFLLGAALLGRLISNVNY